MRHKHIQEIRFADIDAMGHVNNATYLSYFEQARISFFHTIAPNWDWTKDSLLLAKNVVEYKLPIQINDHVEIEIWCIALGTKSFTLGYEVFRGKGEARALATTGESVLVCIDFSTQKTIPVPENWRKGLERI